MAKQREGMVVIPVGWSAFLAVPAALAEQILQHGKNITREYKDGSYQYVKLEALKKNDVLYASATQIAALEMLDSMNVEGETK